MTYKTLGGVWEKKTTKGDKYYALTLTVNGVEEHFSIFLNKSDNPNAPLYSISQIEKDDEEPVAKKAKADKKEVF